MKTHVTTPSEILTLCVIWCAFHFLLLLCRLPKSDYRVNRLKRYGLGFLMFWGVVGSCFFIAWGNSHGIFDAALAYSARIISEPVTNFLTSLVMVAGAAIIFSFTLGHAAAMWGSWMNDDIGCMDPF